MTEEVLGRQVKSDSHKEKNNRFSYKIAEAMLKGKWQWEIFT